MVRNKLLIVGVMVLVAGTGYWLLFRGGWDRVSTQPIISAIEEYRHRQGHLPDPADTALLQSLGFELRVGLHPDYQRISSTDYVVTVLKGFDGPYWLYESSTQKWRHGYPRY